jgi:hypothetical protein
VNSPYHQQPGSPYDLPPQPGQQPPQYPAQQPAQYPAQYPPAQPQYPPQYPPAQPQYPPQYPSAQPQYPPHRPSFDGPLPEAPQDTPPLQWGQPLSAAAPAPKAPPPPPVSKLAVVTLVIGLIPGVGLSLLLGLIALLRLRSTHKRGALLAVIGMVAGTAWVAFEAYVYLEVLSKPVARDAKGVVVRKGDVLVTTLRTGDCIEAWAIKNAIGSVTVVPCTMNHDAEVFYTFTATGGKDFPTDKAVTGEATTQCVAKSKTSLSPADLKTAKVAFLKPVEASWKKNEKQITCVAKLASPLGRSVRK